MHGRVVIQMIRVQTIRLSRVCDYVVDHATICAAASIAANFYKRHEGHPFRGLVDSPGRIESGLLEAFPCKPPSTSRWRGTRLQSLVGDTAGPVHGRRTRNGFIINSTATSKRGHNKNLALLQALATPFVREGWSASVLLVEKHPHNKLSQELPFTSPFAELLVVTRKKVIEVCLSAPGTTPVETLVSAVRLVRCGSEEHTITTDVDLTADRIVAGTITWNSTIFVTSYSEANESAEEALLRASTGANHELD